MPSASSRALLTCVITAALVGFPGVTPRAEAADDAACRSMPSSVRRATNMATSVSLLSASVSDLDKAALRGFDRDDPVLFYVSRQPAPGLVPVHRLTRASDADYLSTISDAERASAVDRGGMTNQGISFYASPSWQPCLVPVYRVRRGAVHRHVMENERAALLAQSWQSEGISFWVRPVPSAVKPPVTPEPQAPLGTYPKPPTWAKEGDGVFSFAIMPDTQLEVFNDTRFANRTKWLADNRTSTDLRFVGHIGDVVNWDTAKHEQYVVARNAMRTLESAKIPYSLAIGNHDTQATGPGGSARDPKRTYQLQRDTSTFNAYFTSARYRNVGGTFEKGKVDNNYTLHTAEGRRWMVLTLELWPRPAVVNWARSVVAKHPDANVIVVTHHYLNGDMSIGQGNGGYGDTSPQYLWDNLIKRYPNIKMVFSGHTGQAGSRVDTGAKGNKVYSFLTSMHSRDTNPTRTVQVDVKRGTIATRVYAPYTKHTFSQYSKTYSSVTWVKPT